MLNKLLKNSKHFLNLFQTLRIDTEKQKLVYACTICNVHTNVSRELKDHYYNAHRVILKWRCHGSDGTTMGTMCQHESDVPIEMHFIMEHPTENLYICTICKASYTLEYNLINHFMENHHKDPNANGISK